MRSKDDQYGEYEFRDLPKDRLESLQRQTIDAIEDFSVSIVFEDELRGSGTLVDAFGNLGILTAYHVAHETLDRDTEGDFCAIICDYPHRFEIDRNCIDHIPLGVPKGRPEDGPDLSLLKLTGEPMMSTLKSKKSFYRMNGKSFQDYDILPPEQLNWWLFGAPAVMAKPMTSKTFEGALFAKHLIAQAGYVSRDEHESFDILRLSLIAGAKPFPDDYRGVSGGGVWVAPLAMEKEKGLESLSIENCRLAGVAYFQGDLVKGTREIFANGPKALDILVSYLEKPQQFL
jgi:hypothetical protein